MNKKMISNTIERMRKPLCIQDLKNTILEKEKNGEKPEMVSLLGVCEKCHKAGMVFYLEN